MGAWGHDSFENDSAMDWLGELVGGDPSMVREALENVVVASGHIDVDDGSVALAAAELVAGAHGKGYDRLSKRAARWLEANRIQLAAIDVELARRAVERVLASSELRSLWDEAGDDSGWQPAVRELIRRLTL